VSVADLREQLQEALAGRYQLERELGRGGMATVYLAEDLKHDRKVALKVLYSELASTLGPERFQREIRTTARLQHPHILPVLDSGGDAGQLWYTMPYVEGESLQSRLRSECQLPVEDAVRIAGEVAEALSYAHRHGIVHRDVKPGNILLAEEHALVADFGIARALGGSDERLTDTGIAVGTPAYISPEQAGGAPHLDPRTDVYSLGCVLYEMLAGEPPFTGPTAQAVIARRMSGEIPRVRVIRPSVPDALEQVIGKALAPVAADRFANAAEFARALARARVGSFLPVPPVPGTGHPPDARQYLSHGAAVLVLGIAVISLAVAGSLWRSHRRTSAPAPGESSPKRLAVLPFDNIGDTSRAYFADGIAAEIRGKLAVLPSLTVIASTSSNEYRQTTKAPRDIARELGVQYLLLGHVEWDRQANGAARVRVSPELVEASTGATKWQQPFDAALTDVFQVQADIAARVAEALDVALGAGERQAIAQHPTANLAAYDAFLKGEAVFVGDVWDPATLRQAIKFYEEAVTLDSTFAPAWAQLARARGKLHFVRTPSQASGDSVRIAAEHARRLAPGRPESSMAWGAYLSLVRRDFQAALEVYQEGLRRAPNNADLLTNIGTMEYYVGRSEEATEHLMRAEVLDPRAVTPPSRLAIALITFRRWTEARKQADRALALAPTNIAMIETKIETFIGQGDLRGAQRVIPAGSPVVGLASIIAYVSYSHLTWLLDSAQQTVLLHLPPAAFDNNRGSWGLALAETYAILGDHRRVKVYADSGRIGAEYELRNAPDDADAHTTLGVALAYLGQKAAAIREGKRGAALNAHDPLNASYNDYQLARIYLIAGETEPALDKLQELLKTPCFVSAGWLRLDPTFTPLRGNPRFERLVNGS
jgi:eukaryotic-like serine/threonine-protein kinase